MSSDQGSFFPEGLQGLRDDQPERDALRASLRAGRGPGAPSGSDDAVVAMSSPPWHTAVPNPFIEEWLKESAPAAEKSGPRTDPGPYLDDVVGSKATIQFKAHSYPTKVPPEIIVRLLMHYTEPGDVVLDGFAGSGMTGVAASMCGNPPAALRSAVELEAKSRGVVPKWGQRRAVLNDLAPGATFLASGVTMSVDADAFDSASAAMLDRFDREFGWMYETQTPSGENARIDYTIWSEVFTCPHCRAPVVFYEGAFDVATGSVRDSFACAGCGGLVRKTGVGALQRRKETVRLLTGETTERTEFRPVRIHYRHQVDGKWFTGHKPVEPADRATLARVSRLSVSGAPTYEFPHRHMTHERTTLVSSGFRQVESLYTDRALAALTVLWRWASEERDPDLRRALKFWVEQAFWGLSWMNRYRPDGFSQVSQYQSGVYYVSSLHSECAVRYNLEGSNANRGKRANLVKLWKQVPETGAVMMTTGDAGRLPIPDQSVDYIFVDPPFGENIYYADLAQVIESWHAVLTSVHEEAIVDRNRQAPKDVGVYAQLMGRCFREFARVLKPGRWMTVEFSNSSNEVWAALQQAIADAGFVIADTRILDKAQDSYRQATAVNAVKQDLMISCYKPATETALAVRDGQGSEPTLWSFVNEHLRHLPVKEKAEGKARPVRERFPDRLYDRVVAYFVSSGVPVPMTASEFFSGLDSHFLERDGMYFLSEQAEEYERFRITFKELIATDLFVTDEKSAITWLRQRLKNKPATYSQVQPDFMQQLATAGGAWNEIPELLGLLDLNFVQDDRGCWLVPDPKKSEHLEQMRTRELLRVFEGYASAKGPLPRFRGEAINAGFKKAWAEQDYARIVAVGSRIPPGVMVDLPAQLSYLRNARTRLGT